jgi:efflux ABC transporter, permease protein
MLGIVLYKSIRDYLVIIKYLGDGYKMIFSFETISLATLYVSVLFVLVFIVVLKKRIEE